MIAFICGAIVGCVVTVVFCVLAMIWDEEDQPDTRCRCEGPCTCQHHAM